MRRRRVKITGIGPVTPAGMGREDFWNGILEPVSRVRPYKKMEAEYGSLVAGYIDKLDAKDFGDPGLFPKGAARQTIFAIAASILAVRDAGIAREEMAEANCAIIVGSSVMDFGGVINTLDSVAKHGARGAKPRSIYTFHSAGIPGSVGESLGVTARTMTMQSSCCAGMDAIGYAADLVASGAAEIALCGGTEAPLYRFPILELRAAGLTSWTHDMASRQVRPFDLWRTTGVVSEGACMFVLEPESSPRPGYSWVTGYAFANDEVNVLCGGLVPSARLALAAADLRPHDIEAIVAWGPGHREIDAAEARALDDIFGPELSGIAAVSAKGAIGLPLGAAPAIDVAVAALSQKLGILPPTVNWQYPDPACALNLSARYRVLPHSRTLINSHGLGGINSSLVLERC
jgi:3-oxoacyl-[acyl-carrier-protein] synthase II